MNDLAEVIKGRRELVKGWLSRTLLEAGEQGVKVEEISELMGKSASLLYKAANIKETEQNLQAHDLIPVMMRTGNFFYPGRVVPDVRWGFCALGRAGGDAAGAG